MEEYLYATARVKALEIKLISQNLTERLLDAPSAEETAKVLSETEYGSYFGEIGSVYNFEEAIYKHLKDVFRIIDDSTGNPDFTRIFRYKYDIHNLKVLLKASYIGESYEDILIPIGTVEVERIKKTVSDKDFSELPAFLKDAAHEAVAGFELNHDPQYVDFILDRYLYSKMLDTAKRLGDFAEEFVKTEIDLININTFLRFRKIGISSSRLKEALIDGGYLKPSFYVEYFAEPLNSFAESLSVSRYDRVVDEGIQKWIVDQDATQLEKALDNYLIDLAKQGKYEAFGVKPILGFLKAKDNEAKLLRLIFVSKINEIPVEKIRERLRDTYV